MKKFPKSVGLLCSATVFVLCGTVAHAANPDQLDNLPESTVTTNLVINSADNSLNNSIINSANSPLNLEVAVPTTLPLETSAALPELQSPVTTQSALNVPQVELPELAATPLDQETVAPSLTGLNVTNSPINLPEVSTSAGDLASPLPAGTTLAQRVGDRVSPFTPTAYIGAGVNLGLGVGDSALSEGRFVVYGKLGFTENLSLRPAILIGNETTFLIPVTYDFPLQAADAIQPVSFVPYVGGGAIIATGSGSNLGFLLTGGVDFPISRDFTATAALNVGFIRSSADFGILLGVAYNIPGFRF